jgi:hypothetical protein
LAVHVFVSVKPGTEEAFKKASVDNHLNSIQVPYPTTLASNPSITTQSLNPKFGGGAWSCALRNAKS